MKPTGKENQILERRFAPAGSVIMTEGEPGTCAFLIQSGKVKVFAGGSEKKVELATMSAGEIFGEMALFADEVRTATVEAVEDCNLILLTRQKLQKKLEKSDPTVRALMPMLMKRLVQTNKALFNNSGSVKNLIDVAGKIYENLGKNLAPAQRKTLENTVLPKLEEFLSEARSFDERYRDY